MVTDYRKRFGYGDTGINSHINSKSSTTPFSDKDISSLKNETENIAKSIEGFLGEERDVISKYRINQGKFRALLLTYWDGKCAVSNLSEKKLLIASHILPWSKSNDSQKGDPFNGLLLSVTWDSLFDKGLMSFDENGKAILDKLTSETIEHLGLDFENAFINFEKLAPEHKQYLLMHRILHGFKQ